MRLRQISLFAFLALSGEPNYADDVDEAFARLMVARSVRCEFSQGTQASWDGGKLKLERADYGEGGKVTFDSIDSKRGKARVIGNAGAADVLVLATATGLTFIEQTAGGNISVTTVFATYVSPGSFVAVQSRHHDLLGPIPSQYHGSCKVLE